MGPNHIKIVLITTAFVFLFAAKGFPQDTQDQQHIEVALRMIGHQVLLSSNDSTSRVLPLEQYDNQYTIRMESEFEFMPGELVNTVNRVVEDAGIANNYILEVKKCNTNEVVYSYEMNHSMQSDIIQCSARLQPKACYTIVYTLMDNRDTNYTTFISLFILIIGGGFFLWKKRSLSPTDPNMIPLGDYQFDKLHSELMVEGQKIELTSKESDLLMLLYGAVNTTIEREVILKRVWGDEGDYVGRTLDVFISKLRKKLEADPKVKIVNIRGVGYKLVMDV
jgi:hypothetical protein